MRRLARRDPPQMVPHAVDGDPSLIVVDATWGRVAPIELAPGVRTVGELEVIEHVAAGLPLVDTRQEHFFAGGTIPGARNIPHPAAVAQMHELDPSRPTVFFCNGPQCTATPQAVTALLQAGYPASGILYYRGGMHDWMTLGFPVATPT
jgi:rhodanese-related sulfurtransferase